MLGMHLSSFFHVVSGVSMVTLSEVRMMGRLYNITFGVNCRRSAMVLGSHFVMFCCPGMMIH